MKKILIAMHYMELGGAEMALLGLLQSVDPERAKVDVMIYDHRGELMSYVQNENCDHPRFHLLQHIEAYAMLERPIKELLKKGYLRIAIGRLIARIPYKKDMKNNTQGLDNIAAYHFIAENVVRFLPKIQPMKEYDLAISFLMPHQYVRSKVRAKKYLAWLHTDYSKVYVSDNEESVWRRYDYIGAISEDVGKGFGQRFPSLVDKIIPIENILSSEFIRMRSEGNCPILENDHSLKLLTIGRYSYPKKMEDIPFLCHQLIENGLDVHWYIIGFGNSEIEQQLKENIVKESMSRHVILLGKQSNPYPFIRCCDIYVQPSRYEGKSITVREAQILCKPVIVTHYPTASSQIQDGVDGVIVPLEREACAEGMIRFLNDEGIKDRLIKYLKTHDYSNESEIEKIYKMCD